MKIKRCFLGLMFSALVLSVSAQVNDQDSNGFPPEPPKSADGKPLPPPGGFKDGHGPGMMSQESQIGAKSKKGYSLTKGTKIVKDKNYTSTNVDENAVQVTGGILTMNNVTVDKKSGDTKNTDGSSFYGTNSAVYVAGKNSVVNMNGGSITTNATGCNAGFAYNGGTLNLKDVTIYGKKNLSRGIHATGGGIINATNLTITTEGNNSSVIATDRGGGIVTVNGGTYKATGKDCAVLYSTGNITANDITGFSKQGEIGVIEGDNSIVINNSDMTSSATNRGMMILQSGSGDSNGFNGKITVNGGKMTLTEAETPLCEVPTNITGTLTLKDVNINVPSKVLMKVDYNDRWTTKGGTGNLILKSDNACTYEGTVIKDQYGKLNVTVGKGVTWVLTADTDIDNITVEKSGKVICNGHKLTYKSASAEGTIE